MRNSKGWPAARRCLVAVSPDRRWAASGSSGGIVTVWNAKTGRVVDRFDTGTGHPSVGTFDPADPSRLFVTGWDGRIVVLDLEHLSSPPVELYRAPASTSDQYGDVLTVSADGTLLGVSGPLAGPTYIVDTHSGALRTVVPGTVGDFSADGSVVLTTLPGGVQRWDTRERRRGRRAR